MAIYVFKTALKKREAKFIKPILDQLLPHAKWNFDLEDCDKILRIDSEEDVANLVCSKMAALGFFCVEL